MSTHQKIDRICAAAMVLCLLVTALFVNGEALGLQTAETAPGYETRLFDPTRVHTIDIVLDDWEGFLATAQQEEYTACSVVIDGDSLKNAAIRAKGNTSLSTVAALGSSRYSFKIEFDHYDSAASYYGLDKLSLNNLIQDTTCMKDYLTYRLMGAFGVAAPLCSYAYLRVNGEDWGLYLAVEAIEESFLQRNYGNDYGALYKPDSMNLGAGRGNGKDFHMEEFPQPEGDRGRGGFGEFGAMGSDAKLQYIDDDPESYSTIFDSAKTDVTEADRQRLIASLKALGEGDVESSLDVDAVLRYLVVHNYVVNGDSYTGSMVHNYYLYEKDGRLSMLPWDYNLAFGTFQGGSAEGAVNDAIDAPLSVTGSGDRPMMDWILQNETYLEQYHQYFTEFLSTVDVQQLIDTAEELIAPYVQTDPTAFCTYEEFQTGVAALREFCRLRSESVQSQLCGGSGVTVTGLKLSDMGTMDNASPQMPGGEAPQMPEGMQQPNGELPRMPDEMQRSDRSGEQSPFVGLPLLSASLIILLLGLLVAARFQPRG